MKNITFVLLITAMTQNIPNAHSFWGFGGAMSLPALTKILANSLQQLIQLKKIVGNGKESFNLVRDINKGINDSLNLAETINPNSDPGFYKELKHLKDSIKYIEKVYGKIVPSKGSKIQKNTDRIIAEILSQNNSIYKYIKKMDQIGERFKKASHIVSPGGAQKLTAQAMGVMIHLQSQNLRNQASGLKLQAQALALENKKSKESTHQYMTYANNLKKVMKKNKVAFKLPRF